MYHVVSGATSGSCSQTEHIETDTWEPRKYFCFLNIPITILFPKRTLQVLLLLNGLNTLCNEKHLCTDGHSKTKWKSYFSNLWCTGFFTHVIWPFYFSPRTPSPPTKQKKLNQPVPPFTMPCLYANLFQEHIFILCVFCTKAFS
jgi:hypothetical protein